MEFTDPWLLEMPLWDDPFAIFYPLGRTNCMKFLQGWLQTQCSYLFPLKKSLKVKQIIEPLTTFDLILVKAQTFNLGIFFMTKLNAACWILVKDVVSPWTKLPVAGETALLLLSMSKEVYLVK